MTTLAVQDIPVSLKCNGTTANGTIPTGISTYFLNAAHLLFGCWVKYTDSFDSVNWRDFLVIRGDSGSSVLATLFINNLSNEISAGVLGAGTGVFPVFRNTWYHVIAEGDLVSNRIRFWLDGVKVFDASATFLRNLNTVTSMTSFIGDSGSPGFNGHVAEPFIANRDTAATQAEIEAIYKKGMFPKNRYLFHWPIRRAVTTVVECEDGNSRRPFPQNTFNAALSAATMYVKDTPMTGRMVDRDAGNCIWTSGLAGYYRHNTDKPYEELTGKRYVGMSIWAKREGPMAVAASQYMCIVPTSSGSAGLLMFANITGNMAFSARSLVGDGISTAQTNTSKYTEHCQPNEWHKYDLIVDYTGAIVNGYIDGVHVAQLTGAVFGSPTFGLTRGAQEVTLGFGANLWPGKLDDFMLFHLTGIPSDQEMRDWYLANKIPYQVKPVIFIDCNGFGPDLTDSSGNNCTFNPVGLVTPYGLNPNSYMS